MFELIAGVVKHGDDYFLSWYYLLSCLLAAEGKVVVPYSQVCPPSFQNGVPNTIDSIKPRSTSSSLTSRVSNERHQNNRRVIKLDLPGWSGAALQLYNMFPRLSREYR
jgi:hypothetical protein